MLRWIKNAFKRRFYPLGATYNYPKDSYEALVNHFQNAQRVCAPDEYDLRQRTLLYGIALYLIARDAPKPEEKVKNDDLDANGVASPGCCARAEAGSPSGASDSASA